MKSCISSFGAVVLVKNAPIDLVYFSGSTLSAITPPKNLPAISPPTAPIRPPIKLPATGTTDPNAAPKGNSTDSSDPWLSLKIPGTCVGEYCCSDGLTWDSNINQCVGTSTVTASSSTTTESFVTESMVNNVLTKKQNGKYKDDVNIGNIQESSNKNFINK
jgi:hypothetical protein